MLIHPFIWPKLLSIISQIWLIFSFFFNSIVEVSKIIWLDKNLTLKKRRFKMQVHQVYTWTITRTSEILGSEILASAAFPGFLPSLT